MHQIKRTYKPVWLWMWTGGLVSIPYAIIIATTKYLYDDKNLIVRKGVFVKHQKTIPIYRITDIQARRNIFGYGTVTVSDKMSVTPLRFVARPLDVANMLQGLREEAQDKAKVMRNELF